jgi:putative nucleotidyltransferase with HDIG domain
MVAVPNKSECYQLIRSMAMLDNIVTHSEQVHRVAATLADCLIETGVELNGELIQAAALLHDITKTISLTTAENHAHSGEVLLERMGYPEVGAIIGQHVHLNHFSTQTPPNEAEIVNYADKRVLHDRIVSLDRRMDYILDRYAKGDRLRKTYLALVNESQALEEKLFNHLPFAPDQLFEQMTLRCQNVDQAAGGRR